MTPEPTFTVRCSCGRDQTRAQAAVIGQRHDDSPLYNHIVSSLAFTATKGQP